MKVMRSYMYRVYPTRSQCRVLDATLEECRWLYNTLLAQRKTRWDTEKLSTQLFQQQKYIILLKQTRESLRSVHSQVLQNVAVRVDAAFKSFFTKKADKKTFGYPRYKGVGRYRSFCYPQAPSGCTVNEKDGVINLTKIGSVKIKLHRPIIGKSKTCTIRKHATGKWYVIFSCEVDQDVDVIDNSSDPVGIDVGLTNFAVLSSGEIIENPRFFRRGQKSVVQACRRLTRSPFGTARHRKDKRTLARTYEKVRFRRHNFVHQQSAAIVRAHDVVVTEDLGIRRMATNGNLAKAIMDASWDMFFSALSYKAESAGKTYVKVIPHLTTQLCSNCGYRNNIPLGESVFSCTACWFVIGRDHNAAINILRLGQQSLGKT